jgi:class 3 adenylate cyclase
MIDREPKVPDERRIGFRIGVKLGDIIGDGINVAARLEALRAGRDLRFRHGPRPHPR